MSDLPSLSGKEVCRILEGNSFVKSRTKGSHHIYKKTGHTNNVSVPVHGKKPLRPGTLSKIIRDSGLTRDNFIE